MSDPKQRVPTDEAEHRKPVSPAPPDDAPQREDEHLSKFLRNSNPEHKDGVPKDPLKDKDDRKKQD